MNCRPLLPPGTNVKHGICLEEFLSRNSSSWSFVQDFHPVFFETLKIIFVILSWSISLQNSLLDSFGFIVKKVWNLCIKKFSDAFLCLTGIKTWVVYKLNMLQDRKRAQPEWIVHKYIFTSNTKKEKKNTYYLLYTTQTRQ